QLLSAAFTSASRLILPLWTRCSAAAAATGLLMEPAWNRVCGVTGVPPILVTPKARAHAILPSWMYATLTPGICSSAIRSAKVTFGAGFPRTNTGGGILAVMRWIWTSVAVALWTASHGQTATITKDRKRRARSKDAPNREMYDDYRTTVGALVPPSCRCRPQ